jgi:23S rRNA pseudouridine2605 synthase
VSADTLEITIHEGRKRQVKRMCEAVGHPVKRLERIRFGPLELGDLPRGRWRKLTGAEIEALDGASPPAGSTASAGSAARR